MRKCLDALVGQTFRDVEIICIDDGSTDGSPKILKEYGKKDNRVVVFSQKNRGVGVYSNSP
ncbi:MAG: glycosyltransferase family 2 protein [Puniceicoccales bacterium]|nr:glycosyltransferase family 2 protein [Puniceicoccales bacterium]